MHSSSFPVDSEMAHKQTNKVENVKNGNKREKNIAKCINKSEQRETTMRPVALSNKQIFIIVKKPKVSSRRASIECK